MGRSVRASRVFTFALLGSFLFGACPGHDDCSLYSTCADSLHDLAIESFAAAGEACSECIDGCGHALDKCSQDPLCNYRARCRLATDPAAFQECLEVLSENYSHGTEGRRPWQGEPPKGSSDAPFGDVEKCLKSCGLQCRDDLLWKCAPVPGDDPNTKGKAKLAVRLFPEYYDDQAPPECVHVKSCKEEGGKELCVDEGTTTHEGRVDLDIPSGSRESVFFKLKPAEGPGCPPEKRPRIPPSRFYPGYLSASQELPIAVYLVKTDIIKKANWLLKYKEGVLENRGQSLVLPGSCLWEDVSAAGVRLSASAEGSDEPIPQCHDEEPCGCDPDDRKCKCPPCIWYGNGKEKTPSRELKSTETGGAGIVGLEPGRYTVWAEAADDSVKVSSRRSFTIKAGEMVVIRTWPNVSTPDGSQ